MKTYAYKMLLANSSRSDMERELNALGAKGWRVVMYAADKAYLLLELATPVHTDCAAHPEIAAVCPACREET